MKHVRKNPTVIMSKTFKDEVNQPSIKGFILSNTPTRNSPVKRKHSPTGEITDTKKLIKSPDITNMAVNNNIEESAESNIDNEVLKALEKLLDSLRMDIKTLTRSHKEIKNDVRDNVILQEEN